MEETSDDLAEKASYNRRTSTIVMPFHDRNSSNIMYIAIIELVHCQLGFLVTSYSYLDTSLTCALGSCTHDLPLHPRSLHKLVICKRTAQIIEH
jgi:hypothetical protein